jgi:hypothetical protein
LEKKIVAPYQPEPNTDNFDKQQANNVGAWKEDVSADQLREN